ncbi:MAG TPA: hypothetical protein PKE35_19295 [Anaerolineales bacterium]|nr:hypothetical protein [Anaerolineales bacterium]HMZ07771.1 hypothetical protein [Anaerolineales bacterium]HNB35933.1 hypothetical protein [Anaerolineales bacterium]HNC09949.1 hypothetical protein [Anaerolineales bacterium]
MSKYDYEGYSQTKAKTKLDLWDIMSILMLLITLCLGAYFVAVFANPSAGYNFLNPALNQPPTPTITQIQPPATWTATPPGPTETATLTLVPTFTLEPSATVVSLITPSDTPTPTKTPKAPFSATVTYIDSTIIHPEAACNWQGVAGTILDANNADMLGIAVRLSGFYNSKSKNELTVSGIAPAYGKSGFEFFLGTAPINSDEMLTIQILDQAGLPLSGAIAIDTFSDCSKNLVLVKFKKNP